MKFEKNPLRLYSASSIVRELESADNFKREIMGDIIFMQFSLDQASCKLHHAAEEGDDEAVEMSKKLHDYGAKVKEAWFVLREYNALHDECMKLLRSSVEEEQEA